MPFFKKDSQLRKTQSTGAISESMDMSVARKSILRPPHQTEKPPSPPATRVETEEDKELANKLTEMTAGNLDLLLSLETQARMDHQEKKNSCTSHRQSSIKFEIPVTPPRSKSPDKHRRWSEPDIHTRRLSRWSKLFMKSTADHDTCQEDQTITIGSKVKLYKRPLPIIGTVKYIGIIQHEIGTCLGIELDTAVGNSDGSIKDKRYFHTSPNHGIFVKLEDTIKVA